MSKIPIVRKARQPTYNVSRMPLPSSSTKVPPAIRKMFLDDLVKEFEKANHDEDESLVMAQKEELILANRAASKLIYRNLVAGLKKKMRDEINEKNNNNNTGDNGKKRPHSDDIGFVGQNRVISHEEMLIGRAKGTFSIEKKRKLTDPHELSEQDLYSRLQKYVMPLDQIEEYGFPVKDPNSEDPGLRKAPNGKDGVQITLREEFASTYTCERCTKVYRVDANGIPLPTTSKCIYHPGHLWNQRINRALEKRYSCCKGESESGGCSSNPYHVQRGEFELANFQGYVATKQKSERDPNRHGIFALDCEMSYTTLGLELTRITVINYKQDVIYEKLVKPEQPILDYNSKFSGIKEGDLDNVNTTLADVQRDLLDIFSSNSLLVGHSLNSDMIALKIFHKKFIDTAHLFPHKRGLPFKRALRTLMIENLKVIIQEDAGHDSKEDASAAFKLVMWKAKTDVPERPVS